MAKISTVTDTTMFQIKKWLGLNENPDGDTRLKLGEAAEMRNWRITPNGSLQIRPGTEKVRKFGAFVDNEWVPAPVHGMWYGFVGTGHHFLVAAGTKVYELLINDPIISDRTDLHFGEYDANELGTVDKDNHVEFFPYQGNVYILDGASYQKWDGLSNSLSSVDGYVPTILTGCSCADGSGTSAEQINLLNPIRKLLYTVKASDWDQGDNTLTVYLPEKPLISNAGLVATNMVDGTDYSGSTQFSIVTELIGSKLYAKAIKFVSGVTVPTTPNGLQIKYKYLVTDTDTNRAEITALTFAEFFNGANDNRVFLYGNGTNTCYYSGITSAGQPTAEYFPAMNQIQVGEANTPITGMIRHFSRLICYKSNATYSISYDALTLTDGNVVAGFYVTPVNRAIGNVPNGQVRLVQNNPISIYNGNAYVWKSTRSGNYSYDERQAVLISDRIENSLKSFNFDNTHTYDHDYDQEYYIFDDDKVLVFNYGFNVWYAYEGLRITCIEEVPHDLYFGLDDGTVRLFTRNATYDYYKDKEWVTWDGETEIPGFPGEDPVKTKYYDPDSGEEKFCYMIEGIPYSDFRDETSVLDAGCDILTDDGEAEIDAYWRSGAMAFDRDWKRKYSLRLWVSVLPENKSKFTITAMSDKRGEYPDKVIALGAAGFGSIDFNDFNFGTLKITQVRRIKLKVKKYAYYRLVLESKSKENTATVISTDIQVRYASNVK